MHLVYLDESGNTGKDLKDKQQPVFVLAALIVPEACWLELEADLESVLALQFPGVSLDFEIHGSDLRSGRNRFKGMELANRIGLRDEWLNVAAKHGLRLVYRAIVKKRFERWMHDTLGQESQ